MKKDGFLASVLRAVVEEEKKKVTEKRPDIAFNQKKQLWYMLMNQVDRETDWPEDTNDTQ